MTSRLFIAVAIPENVLDVIINLRDEIYPEHKSVKWEDRNKLHITLKFLGDVEQNKIPGVSAVLKNIAKKNSSFNISFSKFRMFYFKRNPRILWLGVKYSSALYSIRNELEKQLSDAGFEIERKKFKPHLTLLRIRGRENFELLNNFLEDVFEFEEFKINEILLVKSTLKPGGSVYEIIEKFKLK